MNQIVTIYHSPSFRTEKFYFSYVMIIIALSFKNMVIASLYGTCTIICVYVCVYVHSIWLLWWLIQVHVSKYLLMLLHPPHHCTTLHYWRNWCFWSSLRLKANRFYQLIRVYIDVFWPVDFFFFFPVSNTPSSIIWPSLAHFWYIWLLQTSSNPEKHSDLDWADSQDSIDI